MRDTPQTPRKKAILVHVKQRTAQRGLNGSDSIENTESVFFSIDHHTLQQSRRKTFFFFNINAPEMLCFTQKTPYMNTFPIWTPSTAPGSVDDSENLPDIFMPPWHIFASLMRKETRRMHKAALQCLCGASEFCVEIISLFSCHLGSGCWRVVRARCFMGNTTERHLQQMFTGRARNLSTDLESDHLYIDLMGKAPIKRWLL